MGKSLASTLLFLLLLITSLSANAGAFLFGSQDSIVFIEQTNIKAPTGENFYLAHRITMKSFLLPYYIKSNGYVLAIRGEPKQYYEFPVGSKLQEFQAKGMLPNPLPPLKLSAFNYLMGYSLWISLFVFIVFQYFKSRKQNGK